MSENGDGQGGLGRLKLAEAVASRRRANMVAGLRGLARAPQTASPAQKEGESCDLCETSIAEDHRHMLNLYERQIVCVCETCWAKRSGEADFRQVGHRTLWLEDFHMPEDLWASFQIPIGLAFFMYSSVTDCVVAMYPSPAGATESELHFESWNELKVINPVLDDLEADAEGVIVNRLSDPPAYAIAPIDRCYMLVGLIKANWEGISGGAAVTEAVDRFFGELRSGAMSR